jgi:uncharacterized phage protein (TIGR01671 family)
MTINSSRLDPERLLTRAKRADNGEWIIGYYAVNIGIFRARAVFPPSAKPMNATDSVAIKIVSDTLGQYTDFRDDTHKRIFEGDIVKFPGGNQKFVVKYCDNRRQIRLFPVGNITPAFRNIYDFGVEMNASENYRIIGNIYDNYGLLEVKNEHVKKSAYWC